MPLVGDWTGAGHDGVGYYNPKTGTFYLREKLSAGTALRVFRFDPRNGLSNGHPSVAVRFGPPGMVPLTGHWFSY